MEYYIDGHNLIPKAGISLSDLNDEEKLLEKLQRFAQYSGKRCTVFFDKAPENKSRTARHGSLSVVYVTHLTTADEEIIARLVKAKSRAREITVVSSDHHVQNQSRYLGAAVITSDSFARMMENPGVYRSPAKGKKSPNSGAEPKLSAAEVDEWLKIFQEGK